MKKKRSKLISMLLTLVMTLSLVPAMGVTASAADGFVEVSTYEQLKTAVDKGDAKVKLMANIDTTNENGGAGVTNQTALVFIGNNNILDLNGHTLKLVSNTGTTFFNVNKDLTIKDSKGGGRIDFGYGPGIVTRTTAIHVADASTANLTVESGTLSSTKGGITLIESEGNLTINGGKFYAPYVEGSGGTYAIHTIHQYNDNAKTIITGGEIDGVVLIQRDDSAATGTPNYGDIPVQIKGGTFKQHVLLRWTEKGKPSGNPTEFSPAVEIAGGIFEKPVNRLSGIWGEDLSTKLTGGTFKDFPNSFGLGRGGKSDHEYYSKSLGNSIIMRGNEIRTSFDWSEADWFKVYFDSFYLDGSESNPVTVIPNAWGIKSVKLDGKEIDYFKDWTGEWKRIKNNQDHTLVFEWYPLSSDMINSGYTYDAKYLLHRTNSTDEPTPIPVDTSKNTLELKINKGALPGGYSYDFRLDLKKNGVALSSSTNQHIVMLVVDPAQEIDTRTPIDSVTLNVPKLTEGDKSGDDFTLSGTNTGVSTINTAWEGIPATGAVAGNFYAARITLTAENGYAFNTSTKVKLNGDYLSTGSGIENDGAGMTIYVNVPVRHEHKYGKWQIAGTGDVHFRKCSCGVQESKPHEWEYLEGKDKYKCTVCGYEIDGEKERITYVYASPRSPIAGESPDDYTPEEWVEIGGANYKVDSIVWKDMDDNDVTTFEAGKIYKGTVTFKADTGFAFDGDRIYASKIFNSSNAEVVGDYTLADGGTTLTATFKLKDNTVVRPGLNIKVKLPTLSDRIGKSLPEVELVDTTLPENVKFMCDVYENDISTEVTDPNYKVKPNQKYFYLVWLKSGDSTDITEITKTYNVSYEVKDGGDAETYTDLVGYGVLAMYQTPAAADTSKINNVALTVTAPKYGEAPATEATGADGTFTVGTPTWSPEVTDGKFGAEAYTVSIPVTAAEDYSFDENCFYTINGYVATYADGKVSYTFPALTVPHEHDYTGQPWQYLDPGSHYQACKNGDGGLNIQAHTFGTWEKVDDATHKATCSKCKHEKTENHSWNFVKEDAPTLNAVGTRHYECSANGCKATKTESIPKLNAISAVNVIVTAPVKGATPGTATTMDATYSVANTAWEPIVSSTFEGGTKYTVKVSLEARDNNRFTNDTTFQINGQTVKPVDTIPATGKDNTIITLTFPATEGGSTSGGSSSSGGGGGGVTKYAVAVSPADNGKVTPDKTSAAKDSVVTITTKANDGYVLDTIKATDKAGKEIKLTDKGDGKYTFTMPASKVEVKAAFKQTASKPDKPAEEMKTVVVMQIGSKTMFVNGKAYEKDAAPVIMNDRTLVPIRFVTESLGGKVAWNAETKEVTLVIDGKEIKMTIGKTIEKYGVAPVIIDSRTFVPVRFVADELGATTAWNAETKTVTITKAVTPVKTEK